MIKELDRLQYILDELKLFEGGIDKFLKTQSPKEELREFVIDYISHYIGTFYSWGGDDPSGFDCSGIINEGMQAIGLIGRKEDWTANMYKDNWKSRYVEKPYRGCLILWEGLLPDIAIHIEMALSDTLSIGASGGGSNTITKEDAIRDNAFIKVRPWASRYGAKWFIDPFKEII